MEHKYLENEDIFLQKHKIIIIFKIIKVCYTWKHDHHTNNI